MLSLESVNYRLIRVRSHKLSEERQQKFRIEANQVRSVVFGAITSVCAKRGLIFPWFYIALMASLNLLNIFKPFFLREHSFKFTRRRANQLRSRSPITNLWLLLCLSKVIVSVLLTIFNKTKHTCQLSTIEIDKRKNNQGYLTHHLFLPPETRGFILGNIP